MLVGLRKMIILVWNVYILSILRATTRVGERSGYSSVAPAWWQVILLILKWANLHACLKMSGDRPEKKNIISSGEDEDGMRNLLGPPAEQVC